MNSRKAASWVLAFLLSPEVTARQRQRALNLPQDWQKRRSRRAKNARDLIFYAAGAGFAIRFGGGNWGPLGADLRGNYGVSVGAQWV